MTGKRKIDLSYPALPVKRRKKDLSLSSNDGIAINNNRSNQFQIRPMMNNRKKTPKKVCCVTLH